MLNYLKRPVSQNRNLKVCLAQLEALATLQGR
jgi:hypothetical protein